MPLTFENFNLSAEFTDVVNKDLNINKGINNKNPGKFMITKKK